MDHERPVLTFTAAVVAILCAPILVVVLVVDFVVTVVKTYVIVLPIVHAMALQPLYWLTAFEVKRISGVTTSDLLGALLDLHRYGAVECRFREQESLRRLERILKRVAPARAYPVVPEEVIFFEFRLKEWGGRKSREKPSWRVFLPHHATA